MSRRACDCTDFFFDLACQRVLKPECVRAVSAYCNGKRPAAPSFSGGTPIDPTPRGSAGGSRRCRVEEVAAAYLPGRLEHRRDSRTCRTVRAPVRARSRGVHGFWRNGCPCSSNPRRIYVLVHEGRGKEDGEPGAKERQPIAQILRRSFPASPRR